MNKLLTPIVLLLLCSCASPKFAHIDTSTQDWLEPVPDGILSFSVELPKAKFFEVPASKLDTAVFWLKDDLYLPSDPGTLKYFGQPDFKCPEPNKAFLLRANYLNGGTGHFEVSVKGTAVVVGHFSLGGGTIMHQSALITCLPIEPKNVFSAVSSAL